VTGGTTGATGGGAVRGRIFSADDAPERGERTRDLAHIGSARVEQIVSGELPEPVGYMQAHDEWVVLLGGGAILEIDGERLELAAGDWVLLPARTPHRLVETVPGTVWLAVHGPG
jgi:mannose-6-phosphate isomerase-like protein (cupin superfamily)